jgi:hypothetical protein
MMDWQTIIAIGLVLLAAIWAGRLIIREVRPRIGGCSGCSGCGNAKKDGSCAADAPCGRSEDKVDIAPKHG